MSLLKLRAVTNFSSRLELKKVAGGQKKSGAVAELAGGVGGYSGGWGLRKIHKFFLKRFLMQPMPPTLHVR